ncbi:MAG: hypothetical protein M3R61_05165 [Chloroflexota bacterium]|nr:hypothetical protein [Chloroflexota bacterium]
MRELPQVTLIGVDCVDVERLLHAAEVCQRSIRFGDVRMLTSLPHEHPSIVPIAPITSREAYSSFVVKQLNSYVDTPLALIIQYDGFILNPDAWCDEYLAYDYIGAPWWEEQEYIVGNGGFSLRSKRLLALTQQDDAIRDPTELDPSDAPEDWYLCVMIRPYLEEHGIRFAPAELAKQFAFEGGDEHFGVTWTNQFGFHGLRWTDISLWLEQNPNEPIDNTLDSSTLELKSKLESVS